MNILFICPRFPYPCFKGDQLTVYRRLSQVSKRHTITLLSFSDCKNPVGLAEIEKFCKGGVYLVKRNKYMSLLRVAALALFSKLPLQLLLYKSESFSKELRQLLASKRFDVVQFFLLRMAPYRNLVKDVPCVIDLVDSMSLNIERSIAFERGLKRLVYKAELRRLLPYEARIGRQFSQMMLTAEADKKYFDADNITIIPSTINTKEFQPNFSEHRGRVFVFSGILSYAPNVHAVLWFLHEVYPILVERYPDFTFLIVGKNPSDAIIKCVEGKKNVILTGFVESMADTLNTCSFAVAPMQSGSGMQGKILEAMSCGLPVVTTGIGKGSITASEENGLFVANSASDFVERIGNFLKAPELTEKYGQKTREFVVQNYDTAITLPILEGIYHQTASEVIS